MRKYTDIKLTQETKFKIARLHDNQLELIKILSSLLIPNATYKTNSNGYHIQKFLNWLIYGGELPYQVFKIGNSKLPFLSFSNLPVINCIGAGECLNYCYSLKAWRYPAAFFRQLQNTILMSNFDIIESELQKVINTNQFKHSNKIDFRLYVDGDFNNTKHLKDWMKLLKNNPRVNAYGYSKSLNVFKNLINEGFEFPSNYVLNLSNGGKFDYLKPILQKQSFVRGNFTAVKGTKKTIRKQFKKKVFICPGICGTCTSIGHACGNNDVFKNLEIVIPIH
jgi:hypothetical protein